MGMTAKSAPEKFNEGQRNLLFFTSSLLERMKQLFATSIHLKEICFCLQPRRIDSDSILAVI
jgi:hypothetical protein